MVLGAVLIVIILVVFLIFGMIILIPVLTNIQDIGEKGFLCGAFGFCLPEDTEDTERFKEEVEKQEEEADERLPQNKEDFAQSELLCDLAVDVKADLIDDFGFIKIDMSESDPADYRWYCEFPDPLSWINGQPLNFVPNAFFFESEFIHSEIVLIDKKNPGLKYDANHPDYKSMYREIRITDDTGFIDTPLNFDQSFYMSDIIYGEYILEIYYGRVINDMKAGDPLEDIVCKVGYSPDTKNLRCIEQ